MAFNVYFYTFSKRRNSTLIPSNVSLSISCNIKEESSVLKPTLQITFASITTNPTIYNYAYIPNFSRYYFVTDWVYITGYWECHLNVDVLATYKTQIGNSYKYVVRSAYAHDNNVIDDFYPALAWKPNDYTYSADFQFYRTFRQGSYVLGVVNRSTTPFGAISYYSLGYSNISDLLRYMLVQSSDLWTDSFTDFTDVLYRSVYSPFDYIKSCKWYPIYADAGNSTLIQFGNYTSNVYGQPLDPSVDNWSLNSRTLYLPSTWLSLEAKYRSQPYARIYIIFNPFGVIELNPLDFTDSRTIKLYIYPDFISGDCLLKIYKVVGTTEYFISQHSAKISVDINLSASSIDTGGLFAGVLGTVAGTAGALAATSGLSAVAATAGAMGAIGSTAGALIPSFSGSLGQSANGARAMEGTATLVYTSTYFAEENNAEFGKPLMTNKILNTIPGFIQCQDGEINCNGFEEEIMQISEFLTNGFYYE